MSDANSEMSKVPGAELIPLSALLSLPSGFYGGRWIDGDSIAALVAECMRMAAPQAQPVYAKVQWWLAELDRYGNPALTDGAHSDRAGADRAAYLIESMGLGKGRKFAVARVELTTPVPNSSGVNHEAVAEINRAAMAAAQAAQEGGKA